MLPGPITTRIGEGCRRIVHVEADLQVGLGGSPPHGASVRRGDPGLKARPYEYRTLVSSEVGHAAVGDGWSRATAPSGGRRRRVAGQQPDQRGDRIDLELAHHAAAMDLDRLLTGPQLVRNLLVEQAARDE